MIKSIVQPDHNSFKYFCCDNKKAIDSHIYLQDAEKIKSIRKEGPREGAKLVSKLGLQDLGSDRR
jgi:hypothetical protein